MTPPRSRHSARSLKQILCTAHKIAALGNIEERKKVGASRHPSHFQPSEPTTRIPGNPLDCLRQASPSPRPAPTGHNRCQEGRCPLKGAGSSTDVKMPSPRRFTKDARIAIFAPMRRHAIENQGCCGKQFATNHSEMNTRQTRNSLFYLNPNMWHGYCLNGGCHGY
jgi:hypothetical protein